MHDEKDCKEENEEGCQVGTSYFPTSCASLLRENCRKVANGNKEECSKESIREEMNDTNPFSNPKVIPLSHLEITEPK